MSDPVSGYEAMLQRLKEERIKLGYSQSRMGSVIGLEKVDYCKCEKGKRRISFSELKRLCSHGINVEYIITGNRLRRRELAALEDADFETALRCYVFACSVVMMQKEEIRGFGGKALQELLEEGILFQAGLQNFNYWKIHLVMRGITQPKLAALIGVDVKKFRNIEYGKIKPDSELLFKIYLYCHLSPSFFLKDARGIFCELGQLMEFVTEEQSKAIMDEIVWLMGE